MTETTHNLFVHAAVAAVLVIAGVPAHAQVYSGSSTPVPADELQQGVAAARAAFASVLSNALSTDSMQAMLSFIKDQQTADGGGVTNFDDVTAPCLFVDTHQLFGREQFAAFFSPLPNGGAILNECSNFGVSAHSPPNFLAFYSLGAYTLGGTPILPEAILVGANKTSVSLWVSGGAKPGYPVALVALGAGAVQQIITTTLTSDWVQITLSGSVIQAVALIGSPLQLVVDDIEAQ